MPFLLFLPFFLHVHSCLTLKFITSRSQPYFLPFFIVPTFILVLLQDSFPGDNEIQCSAPFLYLPFSNYSTCSTIYLFYIFCQMYNCTSYDLIFFNSRKLMSLQFKFFDMKLTFFSAKLNLNYILKVSCDELCVILVFSLPYDN